MRSKLQIQIKHMSHIITQQNELANDQIVSYGSALNNEYHPKQFSAILETIRSGSGGILNNVKRVRDEQNETRRRGLKKTLLPMFNMGRFSDNTRSDEHLQSTEYIIIDFDHLDTKLLEIKQQLMNDDRVYCTFISPSGDGLKIICKLDRPITDQGLYESIYIYHADQFTTRYNHKWDPATKNVSRGCFLSLDPEIYLNEDATPLATNIPTNGQVNKQAVLKPAAIATADPLAALLSQGVPAGSRTPTATEILGHCINRGYAEAVALEILKMWNQKNPDPLSDDKITYTVHDVYGRYKKADGDMPYEIFVRNGAYYKTNYRGNTPVESMVTSFTIEPKELLELDDSDCLRADIIVSNGYTYKDVMIENPDWHTKSKLLKAIGHQDCTFHGSENDVQAICKYINNRVPLRKKGTRVIGLQIDEAMWVTKGINITKDGISHDPKVISYEKGKTAFYHGIRYKDIPNNGYSALVSGLYADILGINEENTIVPWVAWTFATPVKPILMDYVGGFPLTFVHGPQGGGKTTTARLLKRLAGDMDAKPHSCKQNWFPLLKLLTATNAIPVVLDEFKAKLLEDRNMNWIISFMNKAYSGEIEVKGREDQTTRDFVISAPLCVMGEWNISVPSVHERILVVRFKETVKKDKNMQAAFDRVWNLPLEAFMPRYIQFCLQLDIRKMFDAAKHVVEQQFISTTVAPRIVDNLAVMVLGIELFKQYGAKHGVAVPEINIAAVLKYQLKEITGSDSGFVQSAVDQLINELSVIALKGKPIVESMSKDPISGHPFIATRDPNGYDCILRKDQDYRILWIGNVNVLAINFTKIFPDFKKYAKQTGYEGDLLDKESYGRLFSECPYIYKTDYPVKINDKTVRSLCVDIRRAREAGINLEGFGLYK